jgi:hypothetical protein
VRAWIEAVEYVKKTPAVFEPTGKALGLDAAGTAFLRQRVIADYATTWNEDTIKALAKFAKMGNEVMGGGFLDEVPAAAFTTRFNPR